MDEWKDATEEQPDMIYQTGYGNIRPYVLCYHRWADPEYFIASYDPDSDEWNRPYSNSPVDVEYWCELPEVPEITS